MAFIPVNQKRIEGSGRQLNTILKIGIEIEKRRSWYAHNPRASREVRCSISENPAEGGSAVQDKYGVCIVRIVLTGNELCRKGDASRGSLPIHDGGTPGGLKYNQ